MSPRPHNLLGLFAVRFLGLWADKPSENLSDDAKQSVKCEPRLNSTDINVKKLQGSDSSIDSTSAIEASCKKVAELQAIVGCPGLVLSVTKRKRKLWDAAFGLCDVENQLSCSPDARMRIASISKAIFAATVVGPMIENKKIDLDAPIHKYLSLEEFPKPKYKGKEYDISTRQLLSHTAGIAQYPECDLDFTHHLPIGSKESLKLFQCNCQYHQKGYYQRKHYRNVIDSLEIFKDEPLVVEPGTYKYTTQGYVLLSAVAQKVHQLDEKSKSEQIEDYWVKVLRNKWNMIETNLDQDEILIPNRARYYMRTRLNGVLVNAPYTDNSSKWAGGGLNSSTSDLIKFGNSLIDSCKSRENAMLKKDTVELLWKPVTENYGLGFNTTTVDLGEGKVEPVVFHTGAAVGASSILLILPESEIVVAIITNLGDVNLKPLGILIAQQFSKVD